jgi:hypothetical protein
MTYCARKPLQVIRDEPPKPFSFVEIMPGSIITFNDEVQKSGLVNVLYDGQNFGSSCGIFNHEPTWLNL